MNSEDVLFRPNLTMACHLDQQNEAVTLVLSDALETSEQELLLSFKKQIADFVNAAAVWYPRCVERLRVEAPGMKTYRLMRLYILSEQVDQFLVFGASFSVDFDGEHGRGLKISSNDLSIIDYGVADVAFTRDVSPP